MSSLVLTTTVDEVSGAVKRLPKKELAQPEPDEMPTGKMLPAKALRHDIEVAAEPSGAFVKQTAGN